MDDGVSPSKSRSNSTNPLRWYCRTASAAPVSGQRARKICPTFCSRVRESISTSKGSPVGIGSVFQSDVSCRAAASSAAEAGALFCTVKISSAVTAHTTVTAAAHNRCLIVLPAPCRTEQSGGAASCP